MPWTAADAKKHKKGLSPKQAKVWAAVANNALKRCEKKGEKDCEARAIKQADVVAGRIKTKEMEDIMSDMIDLLENDADFEVPVIGLEDGDEETEDLKQKEQLEQKHYGEEPMYVPMGVTSFADLDAFNATREKADQVMSDVDAFKSIASNIMYDQTLENKEGALSTLANEFSARVKQKNTTKENDEDEECKECGDDMDELTEEELLDEEYGLSEKAKIRTATKNDFPDSYFLWVEPGCGKKDSSGKTKPRTCRHFPFKDASGSISLSHVRNALSRLGQSTVPQLKGAARKAVIARAQRMLKRGNKELSYYYPEEETALEKVSNGILGVLESVGILPSNIRTKEADDEEDYPHLMMWKEAGEWHWLARYSNNFRDDDKPAEIIAEKSHRRFVDLVDKGLAPYPELWLWHIPEWKIGKANWVAYDDSGFALAAGTFDEGTKEIVEWLSEQGDFLVSHGMPPSKIKRDPEDQTVIIEHETKEISPLPGFAAANKMTGFLVFGEKDMIPDAKKQTLVKSGLSGKLLDELEEKNKKDAQKAQSEGIETKEETKEEQTEEVAAEATSTEETAEEKPITRQEIADGVIAFMEPWMNKVTSIEAKIDGLTKEVGTVKQSDEAKIAKTVQDIPPASLAAILKGKSVIGSEETKVKEGEELSGPEEAPVPVSHVTGIEWIDQMLAPPKQ